MGNKILGGTQANWAISIVDGYYRISDTLNRFISSEIRDKYVILWGWQTESGIEKIENSVKDSEVYFMTDKSKAEIIGRGRWLRRLPHEDLSSHWKDQPQWNKKWEYPYLLEVTGLNARFLQIVKDLSPKEREMIVKDKVIDKKSLFAAAHLTTISDPDGGSLWETHSTVQDSEVEKAKLSFSSASAPGINKSPSFWWVNQGKTSKAERDGGFIWAPLKDKSGEEPYHWKALGDVKAEDIIVHYANGYLQHVSKVASAAEMAARPESIADEGWTKEGRLVKVEYFDLDPKIPLIRFAERVSRLGLPKGPIDKTLGVKQGYLFEFSKEALHELQMCQPETKWPVWAISDFVKSNSWIFQANPDLYDIRGAVRHLSEDTWLVVQHREEIAPPDKVYLWESGSEGGIVGVAEVVEEPSLMPMSAEDNEFVKDASKFSGERLRVKLRILKHLEPILGRDEIKSNPKLKNLSILLQPQGTNFAVTDEEAKILDRMLAESSSDKLRSLYTIAQCAEETGFPEELLRRWVRAIERKKQAVIYGPPGTGKTYLAEKLAQHLVAGTDGFAEMIQFHPSYDYEDFMQGIRPRPDEAGVLRYPVVPGRFLEFCNKAAAKQSRCVLIIDELNRANLSRVFGELMYLLEYRDREIPLAVGGLFRIPPNVRIVGTMNTADRSIALVDYALRRRFAFISLHPEYDILIRYHQNTGFPVNPLINLLERVNKRIGDRNYEIGITFFLRKDLASEIEDIWRMEIEPYLEEYFYGHNDVVDEFRWEKVGKNII